MWNHVPYTTCGIIGFSAHKEPEHMSFEGEWEQTEPIQPYRLKKIVNLCSFDLKIQMKILFHYLLVLWIIP